MSDATPIALIEAITQALAYELRNDDTVVVLGEDVGVNGGPSAPNASSTPRWMKPPLPD